MVKLQGDVRERTFRRNFSHPPRESNVALTLSEKSLIMAAFNARNIAQIFDKYITVRNIRWVEVSIIRLAIAFFLAHLAILLLFNHVPALYRGHSYNYLKAVYTPFSFILVYEVLLLVIILPESMTQFIGKQFEIITLITLRSFFHDMSGINMQRPIHLNDPEFFSLGYDLIASLLMLGLTIIFHRLHSRHRDPENREALHRYINLKKAISASLIVVLFFTCIYNVTLWASDASQALWTNSDFPDPNAFFYLDFFNTMVYADVLLLIVSFLYDSSFYSVMRNASFIISTILLRLSLNMERPANHLVAISAFAFSVAVMLILQLQSRDGGRDARKSSEFA